MSLKQAAAQTGFTLLEVVVALAILAVGLAAAIRAVGASADTVAALRERQLAGWVAENRLAMLRGMRQWPEIGQSAGQETQAGRDFVWRMQVATTPHAAFRRVEISVAAASAPSDTPPAWRLTGLLTAP